MRLARLPTEAEIAAEIRRRPIGAVIADICQDLGIMPGHLDREFWDELRHAIIMYGGGLVCFLPPEVAMGSPQLPRARRTGPAMARATTRPTSALHPSALKPPPKFHCVGTSKQVEPRMNTDGVRRWLQSRPPRSEGSAGG